MDERVPLMASVAIAVDSMDCLTAFVDGVSAWTVAGVQVFGSEEVAPERRS